MANVQVFQRHAHLAGAVKLEFVNGREGKIAKGVLTAISNTRRGSSDTVEETGGHRPAPVTAEQLIEARRPEDIGHSLWTTFQRVQENVIRGGQPGRSAQGRRLQTRPVGSIDRGVTLNRALWMLAEEMRKLKG